MLQKRLKVMDVRTPSMDQMYFRFRASTSAVESFVLMETELLRFVSPSQSTFRRPDLLHYYRQLLIFTLSRSRSKPKKRSGMIFPKISSWNRMSLL